MKMRTKRWMGILLMLVLAAVAVSAAATGEKPTIEGPKGEIYVNENTEWTVIAPGATMAMITFEMETWSCTTYLWDCDWTDGAGVYHEGIPGRFGLQEDGMHFDRPGKLTVKAAASYTDEEWLVGTEDDFVWTEEAVAYYEVKSEGTLPDPQVNIPEYMEFGEGFTLTLPSTPGVEYYAYMKYSKSFGYTNIPSDSDGRLLQPGESFELSGETYFPEKGKYELWITSSKPRWVSNSTSFTIWVGELPPEDAAEPIDLSKEGTVAVEDQTYTGKALKPAVTVKVGETELVGGTDYTVSYMNNKKIGTATVTVKGKGNYTGTVKETFKINPKPTVLSKLKAGKKKITVRWKKGSGITGYQIQYSQDKEFPDSKTATVTIRKAKTVSKVISGLTKGKTCYVRIRTYKTVKKVKYYSTWSKVKKVKVK